MVASLLVLLNSLPRAGWRFQNLLFCHRQSSAYLCGPFLSHVPPHLAPGWSGCLRALLSVRLMSLCYLPQLITCFSDSELSAPYPSLSLGQLPPPPCPSHPGLPLASGLPLSGGSVLKSQCASFGSGNRNRMAPQFIPGGSLIYTHEVYNSPSRLQQ